MLYLLKRLLGMGTGKPVLLKFDSVIGAILLLLFHFAISPVKVETSCCISNDTLLFTISYLMMYEGWIIKK